MEHILADQGLRVTCLGTADSIDELEDCMFVDEWGGGIASALRPWRGRLMLPDQDVVLMVRNRDDDTHLGLIAASQRATEHEPFVLLEAAYVSPAGRGRNLLQRMIAFAMLSLARLDSMPTLLAACTKSEAYRRNMLDLRSHFTAAAAFPDPDAPAVDLSMARMAQRIARAVRPEARYAPGSGEFFAASDRAFRFPENALVVLDLGAADEATIAADARRLYRDRPARRADQRGDATPDWRAAKQPVPGVASNRAPTRIKRPRR